MLGFRKDQPMTDGNVDPVDSQTVQVLDSIVRTKRRLEELEIENARQQASLSEYERQVDYLNRQCLSSDQKKDMYQRHAVALYTRLVDLIPTIRIFADTIEKALHEARIEATSGDVERSAKPARASNLDEAVDQFAKDMEIRKED